MGKDSGVAWTDSSVGYWEGCTNVGPGCGDCFAEARDHRFYGGAHWGPGAPRRRTSEATRKHLRQWNETALRKFGRRQRVFINPHSDVFDNEVEQSWRAEIWRDIDQCHNIEAILVTKRIGNAPKMVPTRWMESGFPRNAIVLATVVTQDEFDRDWPKLRALPCRRGLSIEPQLEHVSLETVAAGELHWVIVGGQSRQRKEPAPFCLEWARDLRGDCRAIGAAFFMKQLGANPYEVTVGPGAVSSREIGLKDSKAGADPSEWPADIRVQEFSA